MRIQVNNLCENIDVLHIRISTYGYEITFCTYHYIIVAEFAVFQRYIYIYMVELVPP